MTESRGRKRCSFFDNIQAGIEDILLNCVKLKVLPHESGRELKLKLPGAKGRAASFRNSLAYHELVDTYGYIFKVSCLEEDEFVITFKEENHDDDATIEVCGG